MKQASFNDTPQGSREGTALVVQGSLGPENVLGAHRLRRLREAIYKRSQGADQKLSSSYLDFRKKNVHDKLKNQR